MQRVPITPEGYKNITKELKYLKSVMRHSIIKAIEEARKHGDLSENAEYHAAKEQQGLNEAKINDLENQISRAQIIEISDHSGDNVVFGSTVTLLDEDTEEEITYRIVGEYEADAKSGGISHTSPIARAIISKPIGETVEVKTPRGEKYYEIMKVEFI